MAEEIFTFLDRLIFKVSGERNALASAQTYLSVMNFSYQGIIDMLEYEGYSETECKYAADNCGADWNEQASKAARVYVENEELTSEDRDYLIGSLEADGFSTEEAEHGANSVL